MIPTLTQQDLPSEDPPPPPSPPPKNGSNQEAVEAIGQRIKQLREARGISQGRLQILSRVSRSYLSRIESGQMTPSLNSLEKIAEALRIGMNRFFVPETYPETVLEDPFIQSLRPFLRELDKLQWQGIFQILQTVGGRGMIGTI